MCVCVCVCVCVSVCVCVRVQCENAQKTTHGDVTVNALEFTSTKSVEQCGYRWTTYDPSAQ